MNFRINVTEKPKKPKATGKKKIDQALKTRTIDLSGKSVCITGKIDGISRATAHRRLRTRGAYIKNSISNAVDYLILGTSSYTTTKEGFARRNRIRIITPSQAGLI